MEPLQKIQLQLQSLQGKQFQLKIQEQTAKTTTEEIIEEVNTSSSRSIRPGGRTKHCITKWKTITKDPFILWCIQGCKINFLQEPIQSSRPHEINFN